MIFLSIIYPTKIISTLGEIPPRTNSPAHMATGAPLASWSPPGSVDSTEVIAIHLAHDMKQSRLCATPIISRWATADAVGLQLGQCVRIISSRTSCAKRVASKRSTLE